MRSLLGRLPGRLLRACMLALPLCGATAAVDAGQDASPSACPPSAQPVDAQALPE
ncbi:hypothetical protein AcdelDRAFT_4445, partial [Acidovorax delafieldii 2AN]